MALNVEFRTRTGSKAQCATTCMPLYPLPKMSLFATPTCRGGVTIEIISICKYCLLRPRTEQLVHLRLIRLRDCHGRAVRRRSILDPRTQLIEQSYWLSTITAPVVTKTRHIEIAVEGGRVGDCVRDLLVKG